MLFRASIGILLILFVLFQVKLWVSEDGLGEVSRLSSEIDRQREENAAFAERNKRLSAEVEDLNSGFSALEERARADLGLIGANETFYVMGGPGRAQNPGQNTGQNTGQGQPPQPSSPEK